MEVIVLIFYGTGGEIKLKNLCIWLSELSEQQVLRATTTGPTSIRLNWNLIQAARGYRLEWRAGESMKMLLKHTIKMARIVKMEQ